MEVSQAVFGLPASVGGLWCEVLAAY